jgi:hypothetical protein
MILYHHPLTLLVYVGRLKVKAWLKEGHSEYLGATWDMRQLKLFLERSADELSRDLLALDRKQCRL